mmetsp:Transcript_1137/g.1461  ORF Transcript_1137/g.1461 Transcript_1137/m.1461 type:complete len:386 (-) Transcript_1137:22-1179(-)
MKFLLLLNVALSFQSHIRLQRGSGVLLRSAEWWSDGVNFECTECGKCCKVKGDVILNENEAVSVSQSLGIDIETFRDVYTTETSAENWVRLKSSEDGEKGCVFLDKSDGKTCLIYEHRPTQCRTYPWWPRLLESKESWDDHSVVSDEIQGSGLRRWNPVSGGCEGISCLAPKVERNVIYENFEEFQAYMRRLPEDFSSKKSKGDEIYIRKVEKWIKEIVIGLNLCPFAAAALDTERVRFKISTAITLEEAFEDFLVEADLIKSTTEFEVPTTLLIFTNSFSDFEEFYAFSRFLEDTIDKNKNLVDEVMVACFHPNHTFQGLEKNDPVHFEKRSPYPVVNLLRAPVVDKYVEDGKTCRIAEANEEKLRAEGFQSVERKLREILNSS